ncbi:hypothetical protein [Streptomyces sp. NPDC006368]|uniref:hypothetical protein n=1 Tax=Streptomyces sp. NPDC006368 TaxID=3156760 RepID=UPI0033BC54D9
MTGMTGLAVAARRAVLVTVLELAALLGVTAGAGPAPGAEPGPAAAPAAPEPDLTEAEAAAPHRADRRHRRTVRPRPRAPTGPAPLPVPRRGPAHGSAPRRPSGGTRRPVRGPALLSGTPPLAAAQPRHRTGGPAMPADPFAALTAMIRAEAARSADPNAPRRAPTPRGRCAAAASP